MPITTEVLTSAVRHLRRKDPTLRPVFDRVGPCAMKVHRNRFAMLVWSIISQQISIKAAASIRGRLADLVAPAPLSPAAIQALSTEQLRSVGLSAAKARYVQDLAAKVGDGSVALPSIHRLDDEGVILRLLPVLGIGRWTAEMFLIFSLGRLDVLPVDNLGLRVGVQRLDGLPELPAKAAVQIRGEIWKPYRSVATWYLWQSLKPAKD